MSVIDLPIISADSHITEPDETYFEYIEPAWRDQAPRIVDGGELGDVFEIQGFKRPLVLGTTAAVKIFIDVFIGIWAFVLAFIWTNYINVRPGDRARPIEIWQRFPKFIIGFVLSFAIGLYLALTASPAALADVLLRRTLVAISAGILCPLPRGRQLALRTPFPHEGQHRHEHGQRHHRAGDVMVAPCRSAIFSPGETVSLKGKQNSPAPAMPRRRRRFSAREVSTSVARVDWPIAARLWSAIERQRTDQDVVLDLL